MPSPASRNIPLFIAFRVFFNARWYYPVLGVLFIDLGVTLEQFALLNVVWAVSIVGLEVPSGAVADLIGRRRIVVLAAVCMVMEMALFAFAPRGSVLLFPMLVMNRFLSGMAEACASGADESLAFDTLRGEGREKQWPGVLARLMRWQSAAFFIAMLLGAAVYDPELMKRVLSWVGLHPALTREMTLRWPLYLTLGNAVAALLCTLAMREPASHADRPAPKVGEAWRQTLAAGRWVLATRAVLFVILAGLCLDSVVRLFMTMSSNYFRLIGLPEASFGVIGSAMAILGFVAAPLAERLVARYSMATNFAVAAGLTVLGLGLAAPVWRLWGLVAIVPLDLAMAMIGFFLSHYLNQLVTDSGRRATVLSFKGLALNLAYGAVGLLFAAYSRADAHAGSPDAIFSDALRWLPWFSLTLIVAVAFASRRWLRRRET